MQSLAVLYRPAEFADVCGQSSVIRILERMLETGNIKNAMLFCGPSGCGKTTLARIFANKLNGGAGNPIELDAASNSGVDNVREIVKASYERSVSSKYKVHILDECHAFSNTAWQAWLKTLEEPSPYSIFIFCTTDPQKIPATILNRVMRFNLTRISSSTIRDRLKYICKQEKFENYEEACDYLSKICYGGVRDGISLLEKCANYSTDLSINNVLEALGNYSYDVFFKLCNALIDGDEKLVMQTISSYYEKGNDLRLFVSQFMDFCIDVAKYALFKTCDVTRIPSSMEKDLQYATGFENPEKYYSYVIDKMLDLKNMVKNEVDVRSTVEVMLLQIARGK